MTKKQESHRHITLRTKDSNSDLLVTELCNEEDPYVQDSSNNCAGGIKGCMYMKFHRGEAVSMFGSERLHML